MRKWKGYGFFVAMAAIILIAMISSDFMSGWTEENYTYTQFKDDLSNHKIQSVVVGQNEQVPTGEIRVTMKDSKKHSFYAPDVNVVIEKLDDAHFTNVVVSDVETTPWYLEILPYAIGFVLIFILFTMMTSQAQGGGGGNAKMMNFGKSRARMTAPDEKSKTFADVAGLVEEKEQLEEIVDFLEAPQKYTNLGARIPKGVIMVGPPGTGKTLPKQLPVKRVFRSLVFPVLILWKCLSVSVLPVSVTCLRKQRKMHRVLFLLMRLMPWQEDEEAVLAADMMSVSRR